MLLVAPSFAFYTKKTFFAVFPSVEVMLTFKNNNFSKTRAPEKRIIIELMVMVFPVRTEASETPDMKYRF